MKKKFITCLLAVLMVLTGCTKTVLVPVYFMPEIPQVLLQEPHKLEPIKQETHHENVP